MGRVYSLSVALTAVFLFWPVLYGSIEFLRRIPGNPALQAMIGVMLFGLIAYATYDEKVEKGKHEATAS